MPDLTLLIFLAFSGLILGACLVLAFSKNLVYSAFSLLGTFTGVAAFFALLGADFLAIAQLLVYIGGIMVLYLFAVLMTSGIADVKVTNRSIGLKFALPVAVILFGLLAKLIFSTEWFVVKELPEATPTTASIGNTLLTQYLLPFELASVLLLGVLVGAVSLGRREVKGD
ncbi:MAG: NADH-quinone oxidoreductase subunit J [Deltaproteobacteria bacterium]|nr:NADH-quinone oxidoreductase subunit J [Deltaproteobacteria bacterium]